MKTKIKRLLCMVLTIVLLTSVFAITASAAVGDNQYTENEPNTNNESANVLYKDYTVTGSASYYDVDTYVFVLPAEAEVEILCVADYSVLTMLIYDAYDNCIGMGTSGWNDGVPNDTYYKTLSAGTYYISLFNKESDWYDNDYTFYFNYELTNRVVDGWNYIDGNWYYNDDGYWATGWYYNSSYTWYYFDADGVMQTGWELIDGTWYYFDDSGAMVTGWQYISGYWYYFEDYGAMATGWKNIGGTWYYLSDGGPMITGWQYIGGYWYYFADGGNMVTGWQNIGGYWYYFNNGGNMATGWLLLGNTWYYLSDGGTMVTGWQYINNTWYYFNSYGAWVA